MFSLLGLLLKALDPIFRALEPVFRWHYNCWLGTAIGDTIWLFPLIETIHILAMAVMFGGMLVMNLRLLGLGMTRQPMTVLSRTLTPFVNVSVVIMLLSGYAMFTSEAQRSFVNDGFRLKMFFLFLILLFHYTFYRRQIRTDDPQRMVWFGRGAALGNFVLWFMVAAGGRAIGFV